MPEAFPRSASPGRTDGFDKDQRNLFRAVARLLSIACMIACEKARADSGRRLLDNKALVAMTTLSRAGPKSFKARPSTSSLAPNEYMSAVSKKLIPASIACSNQRPAGLFVQHPWPPFARSICHCAEANPRNFQSGCAKLYVFHNRLEQGRVDAPTNQAAHLGGKPSARNSSSAPCVSVSGAETLSRGRLSRAGRISTGRVEVHSSHQ